MAGHVPQQSFSVMTQEVCAEVAKPEWWNDEGLKALSARVVTREGGAKRDGTTPHAGCGAVRAA